MDTGTSVGEISGHAKDISTVSYRQARPFKVVTASSDMSVAIHEGPPFKFKKSNKVGIYAMILTKLVIFLNNGFLLIMFSVMQIFFYLFLPLL